MIAEFVHHDYMLLSIIFPDKEPISSSCTLVPNEDFVYLPFIIWKDKPSEPKRFRTHSATWFLRVWCTDETEPSAVLYCSLDRVVLGMDGEGEACGHNQSGEDLQHIQIGQDSSRSTGERAEDVSG